MKVERMLFVSTTNGKVKTVIFPVKKAYIKDGELFVLIDGDKNAMAIPEKSIAESNEKIKKLFIED